MKVEIITIGDELLIGQVVDTNSAWMATRLNESGIRVTRITTVSDSELAIIDAINKAVADADIVLITGGLGPTRDDLTKDTLCKFFNVKLVTDQKVEKDLENYFKSRGRTLTDTNRKQAEIPANCTPIYNNNGTAPGMWFEENGKVFASMPGVPYEMKAMMDEFVIPRLSSMFNLPRVFHQTIITVGVGESYLSDMLTAWELALPEYIKLAYLPSVGMVRLRLSCYESSPEREKQVMHEVLNLEKLIGKYIFGYGNETPETIIGQMLKSRKQTVSVAESCTGGYLSHLITSIPGCSEWYIGSSISYANEVKSRFLGVDAGIIESKGAVSEEVAKAMAIGVREKLGTDWAVATTGVAGPTGGTDEKPVGTVWIALAGNGHVIAEKFQFGNNRSRNIQLSALYAFNMLRNELLGNQ
jgi:nicotinamide-nucleotide amidase